MKHQPHASHTTLRSQQYLECEHSQMIFGEGGARAVSYPVRKLCALLPLPRFAALQPRLVGHVGLLSSLWLPRYATAYVDFFQDAVELLQVCSMCTCVHVVGGTGRQDSAFGLGEKVAL